MLTPIKRKDRRIQHFFQEKNEYLLQSEAGVLRICFLNKSDVRISFAKEKAFDQRQGELYHLNGAMAADISEQELFYHLQYGQIGVKVSKENGRVLVEKNGKLIYQESQRQDKVLEAFDAVRLKKDGKINTVDVPTADGIKKMVVDAEREYYQTLYHTRTYFDFEEGEMLFGLGQAEDGIWNLRGQKRYLIQGNKQIAMPVFLSSKGYGVLFSSLSPAIFADTAEGSYFYTYADYYLDYIVMVPDSPEEIIGEIRRLTGRAAKLPDWTFRYIQSQERYESQKELLEVAEEFRKRKLDLGCIVLDWLSWEDGMWGQKSFDASRFPDVPAMVDQLHETDTHFCMSIWPNMDENCDNYKEFAQQKDFILPGTHIYDAYNTKARSLYWEQVHRALYSKKVESFWCDSSEPITPEWEKEYEPLWEDRYVDFVKRASDSLYIEKGNAYGLYHAMTIYDGIKSTNPDAEVFNLTRSAYPGCGQYGVVLWSGDTSATWEILQKQVVEALSMAVSGVPYWTVDIGAFFVKKGKDWYWNGDYDDALLNPGYKELYVRWFQFGAFLSHFRAHGTDCRREPWNFGDEGDMFYDALVEQMKLREALLPYIKEIQQQVVEEDKAFIKPLFFAFPQERNAYLIWDEYLFGDELLVAPVTSPMYYDKQGNALESVPKTRSIWLPEGREWVDFYTGEGVAAGSRIEVAAPLNRIPLYCSGDFYQRFAPQK